MTGTDTRFGKALVGPADEVQHILSPGVFSVEYRQRVAALVAENQSLQKKIVGPAPCVLAAVHQQLHLLTGLRIHHRFMGPLYDHPVGRVLFANVSLVFQHFRNPLAAP